MDANIIAHRVVSTSCTPIEHSALEPKHDCAVASTSQSQLPDFWKLAAARHGSEPESDFPVRSVVKWFDCAKGFGLNDCLHPARLFAVLEHEGAALGHS
jgi:hypothetical protein